MLFLLLALQMSTTNCIPDYTGGANCTTMTMPPLPQPQTSERPSAGSGIISFIEELNDRALRKKIGKKIAAGDCDGAAKLAYEKGWLEVGMNIEQTCASSAATENPYEAQVQALYNSLNQELEAAVARGDCKEALQIAQEGGPKMRAEAERCGK
jgi:hypothetical protein